MDGEVAKTPVEAGFEKLMRTLAHRRGGKERQGGSGLWRRCGIVGHRASVSPLAALGESVGRRRSRSRSKEIGSRFLTDAFSTVNRIPFT
jgi:hypothetical protein